MLSLPSIDSDIRGTFDVADLAYKRWATYQESKRAAKSAFNNNAGIKSVFTLTIRANDDIQLIEWGPRGGKKIRFTFGNAAHT